MPIETHLAGPGETVLVVGAPEAVNHETAPLIKEAAATGLPNCDHPGLVVDMASVTAVNSIGITVLLELLELATDRGGVMALARVPARQLEFLQMLHLDRKFNVAESIDDAIGFVVS